MTVNDAISKLRVMLGAPTDTAVKMEEEVVKEETKIKMAEATLVDGTEVYTEGELQAGAILYVRAGEGASEDPFAPAGKHETTSGMLITVGESGEITNVEEKGSEETTREAEDTFEEEVIKEEEIKKDFDAEELLTKLMDALKPYTEEVKEMKEKLTILSERFESVADEPAGKKVRNTFSENLQNKQTNAEARLQRLVEIRKAKK